MKKLNLIAVFLIFAWALSACGSNGSDADGGGPASSPPSTAPTVGSPTSTATPAPTGSAPDAVTKIIVGTGTTYPKVFYIDENGQLAGFDIDLVKEIDKRLPEYEFEFQTMEFASLLLSLETKKIDFISAQMLRTTEREQKYLFNKEAYVHRQTKIILSKDNNAPIKTLDDLHGKKVLTNPSSAQATLLENYNKANNNAIDIIYQNGAANDTVSQIASGRADATLAADFTLPLIDPEGKLKSVGKPLDTSDVLYVFRKDDPDGQRLADSIDIALKAIKADGTLSKLSIQWLGADYTKETNS
ncbi:transporter substrate-binding domain-containing protein [Cohnella herbarum]|uniref:Transporter substrate-binding domain-containing protein n=1 Tax=Cohnella herbarum TaxID=2728023 RepID=A0A7Z2VNW6_9BACL|nr:transporter substrate-binding domain-containing protein [Cohnella herbarum]QJD86380.1 transporter substrate-binding domain-containing protein [Cohnella herbarum]